MDKELQDIFKNINEWLRFAESKNAIIVALNGAAIWGILQNLKTLNCYSEYLFFWGIGFAVCALIGLMIALWSFLPSLNIYWEEESNFKDVNPGALSLYFFRHIRRFEHKDYLQRLYDAKGIPVPNPLPQLEVDVAHQIIQNARVTWYKYQIFFCAISITLIGLILPIPFLIGRLIYIKSKK
tara:strand:+ start:7661 stop:8206 length:546 start_codon:yes stop_codon:yes gene_type:complete